MAGLRTAWRFRWPFLVAHLLVRLFVLAVLAPASGLLLSLAIAMRGESALTDQDIAYFLLTPAGLAAGLAVAGLLIVGAILDVAIMTGVLRAGSRTVAGVFTHGVRPVLARLALLTRFSVRLVMQVLLIAAPFLGAAGLVALFALRRYDINYYLTYWPAEFVAAVAVIAVLLAVGAVALVRRLAGWAIALNLLLYGNERPRDAFRTSAYKLSGERRRVLALIILWVAMRAGLGLAVAIPAGLLFNAVPFLAGDNLHFAAGAALAIFFLFALANAVVAALSNGALADVLNQLFARHTGETTKPAATGGDEAPAPARIPMPALIAAAFAAVVAGLFAGGAVLSEIGATRTVEIIAHRGASAARPENTLSAIEKAVEDRADWVEIDVQETVDGEVIVAHDSDFMKLAGVDLKVWNATMADLAGIDIGSSFDPAYADERTPTLRQALETVKGRSRLLIELKYYGHDVELESRVVRIVEETEMADEIAVMSLKYAAIRKMQALRPNWRYGVLAARAIGDLAALKADFLAVNTGQVSLSLIRRAHGQGKQLYVWTVDDPLTMSRMISMGVDGLITNKPALARQVMDARNALSTPERLALWITDTLRIGSFDLVADEGDA
ncbi:MAG: glycerophosphodiester phosphodiesterase [Hyphomicrobiaceae bacterium]|nr:glycerophosphodiester phosphodiesterase [Hyphomicrobiaceae bacterium]